MWFLLQFLSCDQTLTETNIILCLTGFSYLLSHICSNFPILIFVVYYDLAYFDSSLPAKIASLNIFPHETLHMAHVLSSGVQESFFLLSSCMSSPSRWWEF
ncbi:unnamed protein product [Rangifer tarandus platyrhynchus]|uniref:Uncharacterized protein n=1 Tax=Rangifer tarandus platyrhynchus TaxID=3082113 RepID=A0ABN8Y8J9_RANTA|nr:unnamed protein product [Rangifer tarandus platyrhynchus]